MGEIKFKIKNYHYFSYFFSIKLTQFPFREIIGHMNIFEDECFILNDKDDKKNKFRQQFSRISYPEICYSITIDPRRVIEISRPNKNVFICYRNPDGTRWSSSSRT